MGEFSLHLMADSYDHPSGPRRSPRTRWSRHHLGKDVYDVCGFLNGIKNGILMGIYGGLMGFNMI